MNVFKLRNRLVGDYASYISSFIQIKDERISQYVDQQLSRGLLWPDPLIQLNPSFEPGNSVEELVARCFSMEKSFKLLREDEKKWINRSIFF